MFVYAFYLLFLVFLLFLRGDLLKNECHICAKEHDRLYLHCKQCLKKGEPSGKHVVCFSDEFVFVNCGNCGERVAMFKREK